MDIFTPMLRERLIEARPQAVLYAESIRALPSDISGIQGRIVALALHPIKSLGILKVDEARLSNEGLITADGALRDRSAMVVIKSRGKVEEQNYDYRRFSQRECGSLALVAPHYDGEGVVSYTAPGMRQLNIPVQDLEPRPAEVGQMALVRVTDKDKAWGVLENGPITHWLRRFVKSCDASFEPDEIAVVVWPKLHQRFVEERLRGAYDTVQTLFSDGGQLLVTSAETLRWMNVDLMRQHGGEFRGIDMDAFRPNIVIEGVPPNVEDIVGIVRVAVDVEINDLGPVFGKLPTPDHADIIFADPCSRCDVTRVDIATGEKPDAEPLRWLKQNRPPRLDKKNTTTFGVNAVVKKNIGGLVRVGNTVTVRSEKNVV